MKSSSIRSFLQNPSQFAPSQDTTDQELWLRGLEIAKERAPYPFLPAQQKAWEDISLFRLSLLLGPPGTGKTFILSWMILGYLVACMEYNQRKSIESKRTCRILISAFTKTAIENVLRDIVEKLFFFPEVEDVVIAFQEKSKRLTDRIYQKGKEKMFDFHEDDFVILAGTSWTFLKSMEKSWIANTGFQADVFDFICFDEASQMRLADSTISIALGRESARILFVGDNKQLPPVGDDFEWTNTGSSAYDFIHELFQSAGRDEIALQDTFRLNPMLAELPSHFLYDEKYKSAVEEENYALKLHHDWEKEKEIYKKLTLDPDNSIVVILLDTPAAGKINIPEVDLVEELTILFRKYMHPKVDPSDNVDEINYFWSHQFGIISPHRLQNIEIKKRLEARAKEVNLEGVEAWSDTVEKMQGQSRDGVLISMTVSDIEFAMQEGGFLFDKRRFNVAVTRARSKVILIMSPTLLKSLSNDDKVNEGITFLMEFIFQCTKRWEGDIVGYPAHIRTQKISDFQPGINGKKNGDNFDNENHIVHLLGEEWTNILENSDELSHQKIKTFFDQGLLDVRISEIGLWEFRKRKSPTLPFPLTMLNNHYSIILNDQEMEYFDFINHFDWFDEQGYNKIRDPLNLLVNQDYIQITVKKQMQYLSTKKM